MRRRFINEDIEVSRWVGLKLVVLELVSIARVLLHGLSFVSEEKNRMFLFMGIEVVVPL